jgi:hypothetical protein
MNARALLLPIATIVLAANLQAQRLPAAGDRLRVTAPAFSVAPTVGTLANLASDTLRLNSGRQVVALPRGLVTELEVSRGHAYGHSAGLGFLIGAGTGGVIGALAGASCSGEWLCPGPAAGAAAFGVLFGAVGALIGLVAAPERWETVPLERRP